MTDSERTNRLNGSEIAIIGMACRFPGAGNIRAFWENLCGGIESISFLRDDEIEESLVDSASITEPNYVKAAALLEGFDQFDAAFFGFTPREAEVMDPQQRVFLECAWEAVEDAGYDPISFSKPIGLFAGARTNTYLFNLFSNRTEVESLGAFEVGLGNDMAFLSNRVSHKLNLRGPSYSVHTACSTSMVAVHLACQSLLVDECSMALAGGIAINVPQRSGYLYRPTSYASPDGHTRTFDARAQGTVFGSGAGVVVLKRLEDAINDGDSVYAVIKGSAVNNDGMFKAGFTAPSISGQREVILDAIAAADVDADSISYVEAHGTATPLGDPIEIRALTQAFREHTDKKKFCAIGAVKTNFGHLDAAAGIASLIKTALALHHRKLPPSLNFDEPAPELDLENSPFFVNTTLTDWNIADTMPRRAGISSFGVGGTNVHVVIEEAPRSIVSDQPGRRQLLLLSARSETALDKVTTNLARHLENNPGLRLDDVAYTLQVGRRHFNHRRIAVCDTTAGAARVLSDAQAAGLTGGFQEAMNHPVVFMFPGGGAQHVDMGKGLYRCEPVFRQEIDRCADLLAPLMGFNIRELIYPPENEISQAAERLRLTSAALPALFMVEYALARLWESWGVRPEAMIGHSLGEYAAACLAGVFSLEDALALVVTRGRLIENLSSGAMLSVPLSENDAQQLLGDSLSLAAVNAPSQCVVSGPIEAIEHVIPQLESRGLEFRRIQISVAAHSTLVEPILGTFHDFVKTLKMNAPAVPYISNVTGDWIKPEEATAPAYWTTHLRQTVRFGDGIRELLNEPSRLFLEVGPGQTLAALARMQATGPSAQRVVQSLRHPLEKQDDDATILGALGRLWIAGAEINWPALSPERRCRVALPTYPFEHQRYWVAPESSRTRRSHAADLRKRSDISEWFYVPGWVSSALPKPFAAIDNSDSGVWLILADETGFGSRALERLRSAGAQAIIVQAGKDFGRIGENAYVIDYNTAADYKRLISELADRDCYPRRVLHAWSLTAAEEMRSCASAFADMQASGYYSLLYLGQALAAYADKEVKICVVTNHLHDVSGEDTVLPEKATMLGACKVIPQESPHLKCCAIDIGVDWTAGAGGSRLIDRLLSDMATESPDTTIAYRGSRRWIQIFQQTRLQPEDPLVRPLRQGGVYIITGGLGGVGLLLGEYMARTLGVKLALTRHSDFPEKDEWEDWLWTHPEDDPISRKIVKLKEIELLGSEVEIVQADVADERQMLSLMKRVQERFGRINGVLHAAGVTSGPSLYRPFVEIGRDESELQFRPKGYGLYVLESALQEIEIDFCLLFSSNASTLGGLGFVTYSAASHFMDAFASCRSQKGQMNWISANWDPWPEETKRYSGYRTSLDQYTMTPEESAEAFRRVVAFAPAGQVAVATGDLGARLDVYVRRVTSAGDEPASHPRPQIGSAYVAPETESEQTIAGIWQRILGIDKIGRHDNFFDLGGHSLMAMRVVALIRNAFGLNLAVGKLFQEPTVAGLARAIEAIRLDQDDREKQEILEILSQLSEEEVRNEISKRRAFAEELHLD